MKKERKYVEGQTVVVLKEKHCPRYYVVDTDEELFALALNIVRGRLLAGYWYNEPGDPPKEPDYTLEDVEKLPSSLQAAARKVLQEYNERYAEWEDVKEEWDTLNEVASSGDGREAWEFLLSRRDYEYEQVSLEPVRGNEYKS